MLLRVVFLTLFPQPFMKQLCNLQSKGAYFKQVSNMPNSAANDENLLSLKLFSCGRNTECSSVVESQLGKMKGKGAVWSKVKEPGMKLLLLIVIWHFVNALKRKLESALCVMNTPLKMNNIS